MSPYPLAMAAGFQAKPAQPAQPRTSRKNGIVSPVIGLPCLYHRTSIHNSTLKPGFRHRRLQICAAAGKGTKKGQDSREPREEDLAKTAEGRLMVTNTVAYKQLVEDIENEKVKEIHFSEGNMERAIIVYKDGATGKCALKPKDDTIAELGAVTGVHMRIAGAEPIAKDALLSPTRQFFTSVLPVLLIGTMYFFLLQKVKNKGDWEDRKKLKEQEEARRLKEAADREAEEKKRYELNARDKDIEEDKTLDKEEKRAKRTARRELEKQKAFQGMSHARSSKYKVTGRIGFDDVAGIGDAKQELMEVVDFFVRPDKFKETGSRVPRGVLLVGPPGTGKTLLAKAVAGEAKCSFFSVAASEFVEMFVGVGAARVRDLFDQARRDAPSVIFIDELDAVGRKRGAVGSGGNERDQTLNQMLSELDGFNNQSNLVVIAATNRPDVLDPALIRAGRFDRKVTVGLPDEPGREAILKVHARKYPMEDDIDLRQIARNTVDFSGAMLANILNQGSLVAARRKSTMVSQDDLLAALEVELLGKMAEGNLSAGRRRRYAVYEAGRALLYELQGELDPIELMTVIPREKRMTGQLKIYEDKDRAQCLTYSHLFLQQTCIAELGGRAAEEMVYGLGGMSTINENAIARVRELVADMVMIAGMAGTEKAAFNSRSMAYYLPSKGYLGDQGLTVIPEHISKEHSREIADECMNDLMQKSYREAKALLEAHRPCLEALIERVYANGTLFAKDIHVILQEHGIPVKSQSKALVITGVSAIRTDTSQKDEEKKMPQVVTTE